jgi:hypothetical protein
MRSDCPKASEIIEMIIFKGAIDVDNDDDRNLMHSLDKSLNTDMFFDVNTGSR